MPDTVKISTILTYIAMFIMGAISELRKSSPYPEVKNFAKKESYNRRRHNCVTTKTPAALGKTNVSTFLLSLGTSTQYKLFLPIPHWQYWNADDTPMPP